jgi:hypothetical protein
MPDSRGTLATLATAMRLIIGSLQWCIFTAAFLLLIDSKSSFAIERAPPQAAGDLLAGVIEYDRRTLAGGVPPMTEAAAIAYGGLLPLLRRHGARGVVHSCVEQTVEHDLPEGVGFLKVA